jgi:hypothetical protein
MTRSITPELINGRVEFRAELGATTIGHYASYTDADDAINERLDCWHCGRGIAPLCAACIKDSAAKLAA